MTLHFYLSVNDTYFAGLNSQVSDRVDVKVRLWTEKSLPSADFNVSNIHIQTGSLPCKQYLLVMSSLTTQFVISAVFLSSHHDCTNIVFWSSIVYLVDSTNNASRPRSLIC